MNSGGTQKLEAGLAQAARPGFLQAVRKEKKKEKRKKERKKGKKQKLQHFHSAPFAYGAAELAQLPPYLLIQVEVWKRIPWGLVAWWEWGGDGLDAGSGLFQS